MDDQEIASALKQVRHDSGITQRALAHYIRKSEFTTGQYERGNRPIPKDIVNQVDLLFKAALIGAKLLENSRWDDQEDLRFCGSAVRGLRGASRGAWNARGILVHLNMDMGFDILSALCQTLRPTHEEARDGFQEADAILAQDFALRRFHLSENILMDIKAARAAGRILWEFKDSNPVCKIIEDRFIEWFDRGGRGADE